MIAAVFGRVEAGAAYVPIDPSYPLEWRSSVCEESALPVLVGDKLACENIRIPGLQIVAIEQLDELECGAASPSSNLQTRVDPEKSCIRDLHIGVDGKTEGSDGRARGFEQLPEVEYGSVSEVSEGQTRSVMASSLGFDLTITSHRLTAF